MRIISKLNTLSLPSTIDRLYFTWKVLEIPRNGNNRTPGTVCRIKPEVVLYHKDIHKINTGNTLLWFIIGPPWRHTVADISDSLKYSVHKNNISHGNNSVKPTYIHRWYHPSFPLKWRHISPNIYEYKCSNYMVCKNNIRRIQSLDSQPHAD